MEPIHIKELTEGEWEIFLAYFTQHLSENGSNGLLFQPLSLQQSSLNREIGEKFKAGFGKSYGEPGWRKIWIAKNEEGQVAGHIDIRSHSMLNTQHRVLLGMGVDSRFRKRGIGQRLLESVIAYCEMHPEIAWLDLEVLTSNLPALTLYRKMGFREVGTTKDKFRIEGKSYDYTSMTLSI
ncbi:MAG: GNAT family N-acetyltransferase [Bacteroidota bacterium]